MKTTSHKKLSLLLWAVILVLLSRGVMQAQAVNESAKLVASDGAPGDFFGGSVSVSGATAVVGAHLDNGNFSDSGSAYVFGEPVLNVKIDLKPGTNPNCVNPTNSGQGVAVAIFGSNTFNVVDIDPSSPQFGGASTGKCAIEDAKMEGPTSKFRKDKIPDLVCHFATEEVAWPEEGSDCGTVTLTGQLNAGTPIEGSDNACLVGETTCNGGTPIPVP